MEPERIDLKHLKPLDDDAVNRALEAAGLQEATVEVDVVAALDGDGLVIPLGEFSSN